MKLRYSSSSPYARKVRVVAHEKGLASRIELIGTDTWNLPQALLDDNPLGKIPCLILDDGRSLYDSAVICEYLDMLAPPARLFPAAGEERWLALRLQALGNGMMDAAVERFVEAHRPPEKQQLEWADRQKAALVRAVNRLEQEADALKAFTIGSLTVACALSYLDLRFPGDEWRKGHPRLEAWAAEIEERPSLVASRLVVPPTA